MPSLDKGHDKFHDHLVLLKSDVYTIDDVLIWMTPVHERFGTLFVYDELWVPAQEYKAV